MTEDLIAKILDYDVASCPKCSKTHRFKLKSLVRPGVEDKVALFGGTGGAGGKSEVLLTCPDTKKIHSFGA